MEIFLTKKINKLNSCQGEILYRIRSSGPGGGRLLGQAAKGFAGEDRQKNH
jgi:hypothetical protein